MAFPKNSAGWDLMLDAPSAAEPGQWAELGLSVVAQPVQEPPKPS